MPNAIVEEVERTEFGRSKYLTELRSQNFVACPRGNGIDTHRLWETLYMGGFPIVQKHPALSSLVANLPVVVVNSWEEILDRNFLEAEWDRLSVLRSNFDVLRASFWKREIMEVAAR